MSARKKLKMVMKTVKNAMYAIRRAGRAYCHAYKTAASMMYCR